MSDLAPQPFTGADPRAVLSLRGLLGEEGVIFGCPRCPDPWESEPTCEHAQAVLEHDSALRIAEYRRLARWVEDLPPLGNPATDDHAIGWQDACSALAQGLRRRTAREEEA